MHKEEQSFFTQSVISPNQKAELSILEEKGIELWVKREDLIHPFVSGNKFRKLKYNLTEAKKNHKKVLTFGGAYSNHILATSVAAKEMNLKSIGVIRGDELGVDINKTLQTNFTLAKAVQNGMQLEFVSRADYKEKDNKDFINSLKAKHGDFYLIPEGGTNYLAVKGCEEILTPSDAQFNYICSCVGTGGTIAGLINSASEHQKVIGFPALKGDFLIDEIKKYINSDSNWTLSMDYHFGGYAKYNEELIRFINDFKLQTGIPLDPIYTGKMLFGLMDMIQRDQFEKDSKILAIHTGGLQGIVGFNEKLKRTNKAVILR